MVNLSTKASDGEGGGASALLNHVQMLQTRPRGQAQVQADSVNTADDQQLFFSRKMVLSPWPRPASNTPVFFLLNQLETAPGTMRSEGPSSRAHQPPARTHTIKRLSQTPSEAGEAKLLVQPAGKHVATAALFQQSCPSFRDDLWRKKSS